VGARSGQQNPEETAETIRRERVQTKCVNLNYKIYLSQDDY